MNNEKALESDLMNGKKMKKEMHSGMNEFIERSRRTKRKKNVLIVRENIYRMLLSN